MCTRTLCSELYFQPYLIADITYSYYQLLYHVIRLMVKFCNEIVQVSVLINPFELSKKRSC